jgi:nicotinate phosphoribosyltransferase
MIYSPLLNDFYQFTMAYGYWQTGIHEQEAVFHLFFRRNPTNGDYIVASGLQTVIDFLNAFQLSDDDLDYLANQKNPTFSDEFLRYLKTLHFIGEVDAVPEGSVVFANEPVLRIKAPLILCQLLETPLINFVNFSSNVSSMASRIRNLVDSDLLFEFGLRRAQGPDGGITASRAAFLGGFDATSNVLAGKEYDIPVVGTMAHSWVMAFDDEAMAFSEYARTMPDNIILLVDTYDTDNGVDQAILVANAIKESGRELKGIRLDSGELGQLSLLSREKLDRAGFFNTKIYVSGDLTEPRIAELKSTKAPIDGWGIGTHLTTAFEQPALDLVYKMGAINQQDTWRYKLKRSDNERKSSDPGVLQVRRYRDENNKWLADVIYHEAIGVLEAGLYQDLLVPIFRAGKCVYHVPSLRESRSFCLQQVAQFHLSRGMKYTVEREPRLALLKQTLLKSVAS